MGEVDAVLRALEALPSSPPRAEAERLVRALFEEAPGLWPLLARDPTLAAEILQIPLSRDRERADLRRALSAWTEGRGDSPELLAALRRFRHREVLRIGARGDPRSRRRRSDQRRDGVPRVGVHRGGPARGDPDRARGAGERAKRRGRAHPSGRPRDGQARGRRAERRLRRRPLLLLRDRRRARGRRRRRHRARALLEDRVAHGQGAVGGDGGRLRLPRRPAPEARGEPRAARQLPRQRRALLHDLRAHLGARSALARATGRRRPDLRRRALADDSPFHLSARRSIHGSPRRWETCSRSRAES